MKVILERFCPIIFILLAGIAFLHVFVKQVHAQGRDNSVVVSDPLESQFFHNRYLGNPAMAGLDTVLHLEVSYRKQFTHFPGAPVTEALTADYNLGKRVGLGLIVYSDKAALLSQNRVGLTYAYHLPIAQNGQELHFGISGAFAQNRLDLKNITGDADDPVLIQFNERRNAFELDYGMAFTDAHLTLQASLVNLTSYFKSPDKVTPDVTVYYVAAAYRFTFYGAVDALEPQVSLRGVKQHNAVLDLGVQVTMLKHILYVYNIYHSSRGFSTGLGLNYNDILYIQGAYMTQTGGLRTYADGNYEIDMGLSLFRK